MSIEKVVYPIPDHQEENGIHASYFCFSCTSNAYDHGIGKLFNGAKGDFQWSYVAQDNIRLFYVYEQDIDAGYHTLIIGAMSNNKEISDQEAINFVGMLNKGAYKRECRDDITMLLVREQMAKYQSGLQIPFRYEFSIN